MCLMEKLTFQEEEIMLIIWQVKEGVIKDFLNCMEEPRPPYTTVASIVKNLEKKGYVQAKRYGNTYVYSPSIDEGEYKTKFLSGVVQNYFENSYKEMVTFFARKQKNGSIGSIENRRILHTVLTIAKSYRCKV